MEIKFIKNQKLEMVVTLIFMLIFLISSTRVVKAHFGMIIPSDDMVEQSDNKNITLDIKFMHPMESHYLNMAKPAQFGVMLRDKKIDLLNTLKEKKVERFTTWKANYQIKHPGDHIFYVVSKPYWEPAEDCFIVHYTKVIVNAFGLEEVWDQELGLKTEIVPLTRPYGLWAGNVFQGIVKVDGKQAPFTKVEVEYYNQESEVKWPADSMITQVLKTDKNGVFTYAMPRAGWWGFAALNEDENKIRYQGEAKSVEIGAVIWIKTYDMK